MIEEEKLAALGRLVREQLPRGAHSANRRRAKRFFSEGVVESTAHGDIPFNDGAVWEEGNDRSRARYVHGFLHLRDLPDYLDQAADGPRLARQVTAMTRQWELRFPLDERGTDGMAYHDETTAQRLLGHLSLLPVLERLLPAGELDWLQGFTDRTASLLAAEEFHAGVNNHGMFQDVAVLRYVALASWRTTEVRVALLQDTLERLGRYFRNAFTDEGVHIENTPTYHVMISRAVREHAELLQAIDHPEAGYFADLMVRLARYATHAVMPNGVFPPVSDTQQIPLTNAIEVYRDDGFTYAATKGARGQQPHQRVLVLPRSGYASYRSAWGDESATFVFLQAAYDADYHKHADENSFVLRSGGIDLLSEAGPHGYNYKDPLTRYGYSQFAHNTLIVDGVSIPRADGQTDRVTMDAPSVADDGFTVIGRNGRLVDAEHDRTLAIVEVDGFPQIDVTDTVTSERPRTYELLWNIGPEVRPEIREDGFTLHHRGNKVLDATFQASAPLHVSAHRGQKSPTYLGWRFPKFDQAEPADVVRVAFAGTTVEVTTAIRLPRTTTRSASGRKAGSRGHGTARPASWATMFREYVEDPLSAWPRRSPRQAEKVMKRLDVLVRRTGKARAQVIDEVVSAAERRMLQGRPMTVFLVNCGSSGSHWLEPMLGELGGFAAGGEIYLPRGLRERMLSLSPSARTSLLDAVHLLHAGASTGSLSQARIINTAHDWVYPELFHDASRTVLLTRHPVDIVMSRTFRKDGYRATVSPKAGDRAYLMRNVEVVNTFYAAAMEGRWDHRISYEELRDNGPEALIALGQGLGLGSPLDPQGAAQVHASFSAGGKNVDATNLYSGPRTEAPDWAREMAAGALSDSARAFGYVY